VTKSEASPVPPGRVEHRLLGRRQRQRVRVVEVGVGQRRHHDVAAGLRRLGAGSGAGPRHDRGGGVETVLQDVVPADPAAAAAGEELADAVREVRLELMRVGEPELRHARLRVGALLPLDDGHLVAADVHDVARKEVEDLGQTSSRNANVESFTFRMSSWMPTVVSTGIGTPVLPSSGIRRDRGDDVPGHVDLGDDPTWCAAANATTSRTSSCV
jgi:hypothetical protein